MNEESLFEAAIGKASAAERAAFLDEACRDKPELRARLGPIATVAFSRDGQRIATGSRDGTAKVWEAATAKQVAAWQAEEQAARQQIASGGGGSKGGN